MKTTKLLAACLTATLLLSGCNDGNTSRNDTQTIATEGDYAAILPFKHQ